MPRSRFDGKLRFPRGILAPCFAVQSTQNASKFIKNFQRSLNGRLVDQSLARSLPREGKHALNGSANNLRKRMPSRSADLFPNGHGIIPFVYRRAFYFSPIIETVSIFHFKRRQSWLTLIASAKQVLLIYAKGFPLDPRYRSSRSPGSTHCNHSWFYRPTTADYLHVTL